MRQIVQQWYRDSCSCAQTTIATLALMKRMDPLDLLGRSLTFRVDSVSISHEEYYAPSDPMRGPLGEITPHTEISSSWNYGENVTDLEAAVERGPIILAVDNYYLPFRPAYLDVHAAHLVVVTKVKTEGGGTSFYVSDAQPPSFQGWVPAETLYEAWDSANPADDQDEFFSSTPVKRRYLTVDLAEHRVLDLADCLHFIDLTAHHLQTGVDISGGNQWVGIKGLAQYRHLFDRSEEQLSRCKDLYILGWWHQAQARLHAELLERFASRGATELALPILAANGIATSWTNVRLAGAHANSMKDIQNVKNRLGQLQNAYEKYVVAAHTLEGRAQNGSE